AGAGATVASIAGGATAANTLTGNGIASTWSITNANAGSLTDASGTVAFSNIGSLIGGTAADNITLAGAGATVASIAGGATAANTLTGNNLASTWSVTNADAGSLTDSNGTVAFSQVGNLTGNANNDTFSFA